MPNYIANRLHLSGEQSRIDELFESIKGEETVIDFNKIIPMPESLNTESGSRTNNGLKAYKDFVKVYTMDSTLEKDLLNIPKESEETFLKMRPDIDVEIWSLAKQHFRMSRNTVKPIGISFIMSSGDQNGMRGIAFLSEDNTIEFYTAWSRVMPIVQKLAENYPDIKFEYSWADENLGCNVGSAELENGQVVQDLQQNLEKAIITLIERGVKTITLHKETSIFIKSLYKIQYCAIKSDNRMI